LFFKSIRFRLTLWYAVTLGVILFLFSALLYLKLRDQLYREVDGELLAIAESLASPTLAPFRDSSPAVFDQVLEDFLGARIKGKYVQFLSVSGEAGAHATNLKGFKLRLSQSDLRKALLGNTVYTTTKYGGSRPLRVISYPIFDNNNLTMIVQAGTALQDAEDRLHQILMVFSVSIPAALILFSCGGWFLAGRALKPVDLITRTAQKISVENLSQRLEVVNQNDEIGRLATTFNTTLARLEDSFIRTRQFSVDVSHELRTPLTILRGETEVGLKWIREPEEFRQILQSNLEEINRMSGIIEYMLDLSKAEAGDLSLDLRELDLKDLLAEQVQSVRLLAREKHVNLVFEGNRSVFVKADEMHLRQVFRNLLDNAVQYTSAGGEVRLAVDVAGSRVKVTVLDTGIGIPAESLPKIFDRFYRVDKARNRAHGGSGLGLSLAKSFVEAHGGTIEVSSEPGQGSVFTVYLPLTGSA
jgi:heavy metal sensor kinase